MMTKTGELNERLAYVTTVDALICLLTEATTDKIGLYHRYKEDLVTSIVPFPQDPTMAIISLESEPNDLYTMMPLAAYDTLRFQGPDDDSEDETTGDDIRDPYWVKVKQRNYIGAGMVKVTDYHAQIGDDSHHWEAAADMNTAVSRLVQN